MDALTTAWLDEDFAEPYSDLDAEGRELRDSALTLLKSDAVGAFVAVAPTFDTLDEAYQLLSWIDDAQIWR